MFSETAELYDLIYSQFKNYPVEAAKVAELIRAAHPAASTVLDVACGTGEHLRLLTEQHGFRADGIDLDPVFVGIARNKASECDVYEADMTSFSLDRRYDVVMCMFSSIGYVRTLDNVTRALVRFRAHLNDGGIVLVEPWFAPDKFTGGRVFIDTSTSDSVSVARMCHTAVEGRISTLHFGYLIGRPDGIQHKDETHELGMFTVEETLNCFREAGLDATHDVDGLNGRGLFIARAVV